MRLDERIEAGYHDVDQRLALLRHRVREFERLVRAAKAKAAGELETTDARAYRVGQQFAERARFVCPLSCPARPASELALWPSSGSLSPGERRTTISEGREPGQWRRGDE